MRASPTSSASVASPSPVPTEYVHRLLVYGPARALARFEGDASIWEVQPWAGMFGLKVDHPDDERLIHRYNDDYKRPAPSIEKMAAEYPDLTFTAEYCDEFGTVAVRPSYAGGVEVAAERVDPYELDWIEWQHDEEE